MNRVNHSIRKNDRSASFSDNGPPIIQYSSQNYRNKTPTRQLIVPEFSKAAFHPSQRMPKPRIMPHYRVIHSNKYGFLAPAYEHSFQDQKDSLYYRQHQGQRPPQLLSKNKYDNSKKRSRENFVPRISSLTPVRNINNPGPTPPPNFLLDSNGSHNSRENLKLSREYHINPRLRLTRSRLRNSQTPTDMCPAELRVCGQKTDSKYLDITLDVRSPTPTNETLNISLDKINTDASYLKPTSSRAKSNHLQRRRISRQNSSRKSLSQFDESTLYVSPRTASDNIQKAVNGALSHTIHLKNLSFYQQKDTITKKRIGYVSSKKSVLLNHL